MVEESLRKARIPIAPCTVIVHHYGKMDAEKEARKGEDYYLLGKVKYENDPTNVRYINELAKQAQVLDKYEEAVELWLKLIALLEADSHSAAYEELRRVSFGDPLSEIYIQLASAYLMLDLYEDALSAAGKAVQYPQKPKEYVHIYVHCEIIAGALDKAALALNELLTKIPDYKPALFMMAVIDCLEGRMGKAEEIFQSLRQDRVDVTPPLNRIAQQLLSHSRRNEAMALLKAVVRFGLHDEESMALVGAFTQT